MLSGNKCKSKVDLTSLFTILKSVTGSTTAGTTVPPVTAALPPA